MARVELSDTDMEVAERYLGDELPEAERAAFELRLLAEGNLFEQVQALELAGQALRPSPAPAAIVPRAQARPATPLRSSAWLGWAAALVLCVPAGLGLRELLRPVPDVQRGAGSKASLTIEHAVHLVAGAPAGLPRGVTLLDAPGPAGAASDAVRVELLGPRGERPLQETDAPTVAGRVLCVVDTRAFAPGPWRLEITLVSADGASVAKSAFELQLER